MSDEIKGLIAFVVITLTAIATGIWLMDWTVYLWGGNGLVIYFGALLVLWLIGGIAHAKKGHPQHPAK